jgi:hypothetical protein
VRGAARQNRDYDRNLQPIETHHDARKHEADAVGTTRHPA